MSGSPPRYYPRLVLGLLGLLMHSISISCTQAASIKTAVHPKLVPFPLSAITLTAGSQEAKAAELNAEYLRMIEPDSLLWTFRNNAGLPTPGMPYYKVHSHYTITAALPFAINFNLFLPHPQVISKISRLFCPPVLDAYRSCGIKF